MDSKFAGSSYAHKTVIAMQKILVIGGGGREHAIGHFLHRAYPEAMLFFAPGNAGTSSLGTNLDIQASDIEGLLQWAIREGVDWVVVGPEQPLVAGIADQFSQHHIPVVGPKASAARLEGSKAYAKQFMQKYGIPTAAYRTFSSDAPEEAHRYIDVVNGPLVVKASGLAAGKGAIVCMEPTQAHQAVSAMLEEGRFGKAGQEIVIEEFLVGEEASLFVATTGSDYVALAPAQDHKRIGEGDTGPNTGGMGAYAPTPVMEESLIEEILRQIVEPTLEGMMQEGTPYTGFLYVGLMLTASGPKVIEYNCRLGDPETQVVLPILEYPTLFEELAQGRLSRRGIISPSQTAACIVLASQGYPGAYEKGKPIQGLDTVAQMDQVYIYHAGTTKDESGTIYTAGGRVLGVAALGDTLAEALERGYQAVDQISFEGKYYRRDIGQRGLRYLR